MTKLPLDGVRVVDFTVVWAGPFGTQILADLGAEVIKVENIHVWQSLTRGAVARPPKAALLNTTPFGGGYPDNEPGERPWNRCPTFVHLYRNKKSFTVDIRRPEGMALLRQLIAVSDIVYENNVTETMEKLGITYDWLRGIRDDIIYIRVPAYGSSGPYKNYRALGVHIEAVLGHTLLRGYPDMDPSANTAIYAGDYLAGAQGAFAAMAALNYRDRTGKGQLIEIGQAENGMAMFAEAILDYTLNGRVQETIGNRDIHGAAPCGVYPASGEDAWIAVTCYTDEEWQALVGAMGMPEWARDERFATAPARHKHQDELDAGIAAWTGSHDHYEMMRLLQTAGVPSGPVLSAGDVTRDPQLLARDFFEVVTAVDFGTRTFPGMLYKLSETPLSYRTPPVALGEYNDYVYREVFGFSDEEFRRFTEAGHIGTDFDAAIP
jgi:crotonobetainyl-CoA:carnitine CoA-transferase CaiB-like acyl-CoA transferase